MSIQKVYNMRRHNGNEICKKSTSCSYNIRRETMSMRVITKKSSHVDSLQNMPSSLLTWKVLTNIRKYVM